MTRQALTVLIVEDNPDDFLLLKEVLDSSEEIRVDIRLAERLETAIAAANTEALDAAILDLSPVRHRAPAADHRAETRIGAGQAAPGDAADLLHLQKAPR